jgi:hypothetical protein
VVFHQAEIAREFPDCHRLTIPDGGWDGQTVLNRKIVAFRSDETITMVFASRIERTNTSPKSSKKNAPISHLALVSPFQAGVLFVCESD